MKNYETTQILGRRNDPLSGNDHIYRSQAQIDPNKGIVNDV